MRIDDLNRTPLTQGPERTDQAADKHALDKTGKAAAGADQADVSELAQVLASGDPQRLERLEQLRLEVQSGKYKPSAEAIANSIIDSHLKE